MNSSAGELTSLDQMIQFLQKDMKHNDIRRWDYIKDSHTGKDVEVALIFEKPTGFSGIAFFVPIHWGDIVFRQKKVQLEDRREENNVKYYTLNLGRRGTSKIRNNVMKAIRYLEGVANRKEVGQFLERGENDQ